LLLYLFFLRYNKNIRGIKQMKTRVAIYGFGRLGRAVYHIASRRSDLEVVMVVSDDSPEYIVNSLMTDTVYASLEQRFETAEGGFRHDEHHVHVRPVKSTDVWQGHDIAIVIDTISENPTKETVKQHQSAGAKRVLFAAPSHNLATIVYGVNDHELKDAPDAITGGGAEQAAASPVLEIIDTICGREKSLLTTVNGSICDCQSAYCESEHEVLEPFTTTGAVLEAPKLVASLTEVAAYAERSTTVEKLNAAFEKAAKEPYYQGILVVRNEPVKADDSIGESFSAIIDLTKTAVAGGRLLSVKIWYDREWGYANRLVELTADYGKVK
jgi:glyceraldehyde 3-phosphate dehydrogenase